MPSKSGQVTLKDVARIAKCSTAVVSTVVNGAKGNTLVSPQTRERVTKAAAQLGYRPNFASRSLASRRTRTVGIYIPPSPWSGLGFSYDGTLLRGVEAAAAEAEYDLLVVNASGGQDAEKCDRKFAECRIDGLLLIHAEPGALWLREMIKARHNIVAVDYAGDEPQLDVVTFDNGAVGRLAVEHLRALGHTRIGFVGSCRDPLNMDAVQRQQGYKQAMASAGLPVAKDSIFDVSSLARPIPAESSVCQTEGELAARYIMKLDRATAPTAWICYADLVAVHMMRDLQRAGVHIPEDISVVGVDDTEWAEFVRPKLTTVRHPLEDIGRRATELLIQKSEVWGEQKDGPQRLVFAPELIVRGSTSGPAGRSL